MTEDVADTPFSRGKAFADTLLELMDDPRSRKVLLRKTAEDREAARSKNKLISKHTASRTLVDKAVSEGYAAQPLTREAAINFLDLHVRSLKSMTELGGQQFDRSLLPEDVRNALDGTGTYTTTELVAMTKRLHNELQIMRKSRLETQLRTILKTAKRVNEL